MYDSRTLDVQGPGDLQIKMLPFVNWPTLVLKKNIIVFPKVVNKFLITKNVTKKIFETFLQKSARKVKNISKLVNIETSCLVSTLHFKVSKL